MTIDDAEPGSTGRSTSTRRPTASGARSPPPRTSPRGFKSSIEGDIAPGAEVWMTSTYPGHEGQRFVVRVTEMTPPRRFAWQWHPGAVDPAVDYSREPWTTVTFTLEPSGRGTRLSVSETGFNEISLARRAKVFAGQQPGLDRSASSGSRSMPKRRTEKGLAGAALLFAALGDPDAADAAASSCPTAARRRSPRSRTRSGR